jgi:pantoate--beta-alanine ligase
MNIVTDIKEWQIIQKKCSGLSVGFVPTMGHLHAGHLSLCERAKSENEITVASIFINPMQFNQSLDFERYPRTLEHDKAMLLSCRMDYLFLPNTQSMYPDDYQVKIVESNLSTVLEGKFRPGHFSGMLTIVLKLLNLIQPNRAYFGEKDYQQWLLIKKMVDALFLPIDIIACETIRAEDGLALSSRNSRLNESERVQAAHFPRLLQSALGLNEINEQLKLLGFKVDYVAEHWQRRLGAVWLNDVRLIDNIPIA